jgi:hypothetical protein
MIKSATPVANFQKIPELWSPVPLVPCMKTYCWLNRNRLLSHLRTSFCALAIAGASLSLPRTEASGPPLPASGEFSPCFSYAGPPRQVGENLIITFNITGSSTDSLTGSLNGTEMDVVHPDGSINLHGSIVFAGSVGNNSGTLLFTYEGIGNAVTGHENLHAVGGHGTGGLAGVNVNITLEGDLGGGCDGDFGGHGTYTGQILFAP